MIGAAHDQQGRSHHRRQGRRAGEVGPATARNHGSDARAEPGRRDQGSGAARAGAEVSDGRTEQLGLGAGPGRRVLHAPRQQGNVEAVLTGLQVDLFFHRGEQV